MWSSFRDYIEQKNVTKNGTLKSTTKPWKMDTMTYFCPAHCVMMGRVVSIVVAPPDEMGARLPNQRTISGAPNKVIISRAMFDNKAEWKKLAVRAMKADFSWEASAKLYIGLYKELCGE